MTGLPSSRDRRQRLAALLGGLGTTGALGLAGCSGGGGQSGLGETSALGTEGQSSPGSKSTPVKVGLLLPLSASTQTALVAKAMREAAELALFESRGAELQLVIKDDKGTEDGARAAATEAIGQGAEIILGPLFAKSVRAAAAVARKSSVPVIAFSNDPAVAGNGAFLIGFGVVMPLVQGAFGVALGTLAGLSTGGAAVLGVMAASASYIAAPAAVRIALPQANPAYYLGASLGVTFPFNLSLGIPYCYALSQFLHGGR